MHLRSVPLLDRLPGAAPVCSPLLLEIDLARGMVEQAPKDPLSALRQRNTPTLGQVLRGLRHAADDEQVAAVVLLLGAPIATTHADELAIALREVSAAGTRTVAFAESYGELVAGTLAYTLATSCDEVWLQPSGSIGLTGVAVSVTLLRGALDKLGIEPQFGQRHEYKTAANTYSAPAVTEPQREMMQRLADSVMERARVAIASHRRLSPEQVDAAVAASPVDAVRARELRLIDRVGYRDEVYTALRESVGRDGEMEQLFAHRYARRVTTGPAEQLKRRNDPVVALVPVHGQITSGRSRSGGLGGGSAGSDTVVAALESVHERDDVKAVVLHVDSPGGSYTASDAIRRAVQQVRATGRPVVASMGSLAASGGYFVSMNADRVVALATTLTGSIGVLGGKLVLQRALDRVGVVSESMSTHPNATMFSTLEPFSKDQWQLLDRWLDRVYDDFTRQGRTGPGDGVRPAGATGPGPGVDRSRRGRARPRRRARRTPACRAGRVRAGRPRPGPHPPGHRAAGAVPGAPEAGGLDPVPGGALDRTAAARTGGSAGRRRRRGAGRDDAARGAEPPVEPAPAVRRPLPLSRRRTRCPRGRPSRCMPRSRSRRRAATGSVPPAR
ncbi:MAG: S49 family peptidase [Actinomycetota bacterium]|nr:S49 family peptidase [Actinomycetota bacterium]